jgi:hypothetical protein
MSAVLFPTSECCGAISGAIIERIQQHDLIAIQILVGLVV